MIRNLNSKFLRLVKSPFTRNAGGLMIASITAQLIGFISYMLISRTYSQDIMGDYFVFGSHASILSTISLLCYQHAFPNMKTDAEIRSLFKLVFMLGFSSSVLILIVGIVVGYAYPYFLSIYVFSLSILSVIEYYYIRTSQFKPMMLLRVMPSVIFFGLLLIALMYDYHYIDYLMGAQVIAVSLLICFFCIYLFVFQFPLGPFSWKETILLASRHKNFAKYLMPSQLFYVAAYNLPTILLGRFFGVTMAAQWGMVLRLCFGPIGIITNSLAKSYHSVLSHMVLNKSPDGISQFYRLARVLLVLGVIAGGFIAVIIPIVLQYFFSGTWDVASKIVVILSPMFAVMVIGMPLGTVFLVLNRQRYVLWIQLTMLAISCFSFGVAVWVDDLILGVAIFCGLNVVRYVVVFFEERKTIEEGLGPEGC